MSTNNFLTFPRVRTPDSNRTVMRSGNSESEGIQVSGERLDIYFCYLYPKIFNLHLLPELRKTRRNGIKWINKNKDEQEKPKQKQMVDSNALRYFDVTQACLPFKFFPPLQLHYFFIHQLQRFLCNYLSQVPTNNYLETNQEILCARLIITSIPEHLQNIVVEL